MTETRENKKRKYDRIYEDKKDSEDYNLLKDYVEHYIKNDEDDKTNNVIKFRQNLIESNEELSYSKFDIIYNNAKYNIISLWNEGYNEV